MTDAADTQIYKIEAANLPNVPYSKYPIDFAFIVNGERFETCRPLADFLSPKVIDLHLKDDSQNYFKFDTKHKNGDFQKVLDYAQFKETPLTDQELKFFQDVMIQLGNKKECFRLSPLMNEEITEDNVFKKMKKKVEYQFDLQDEVNFIAFRFEKIFSEHLDELCQLSSAVIEQILISQQLHVSDEDILLDFVMKLYEENHKKCVLFAYISFLNVSSSKIEEFLSKFEFEDINGRIWEKLKERLSKNIDVKSLISSYQENIKEYNRRYSKEVSIIDYLNKECGGDIIAKGRIYLSASSYGNGDINQILDLSTNSCFYTKNQPDSYILFDFKSSMVQLKNYSLTSGENKFHLRNWVLESSDDGFHFETIHQESNCSKVNGSNQKSKFNVRHKKYQRFIRLRITGNDWNDSNYLELNSIEFYGNLIEYLSPLNIDSFQSCPININEYLTSKCGGNIFDNGEVEITTSNDVSSGSLCDIVNLNDGYIYINKSQNEWVRFDFKGKTVLVDTYYIKTGNGGYNLRNWVLEASDEKDSNYEIIDMQRECQELRGNNKEYIFKANHAKPQRYLRLRCDGQNWNGSNILELNRIIFYGYIYQ